jgi:hypothetical protein
MFEINGRTRRDFIKSAGTAGALIAMGQIGRVGAGVGRRANSTLFRVESCPVHDNEMRHRGVDALFRLLADNGAFLYKTASPHPWGGPGGKIAAHDVVLIKVNCQWKCRGTTNTDVVRGLIHRILQHPDGFTGEIVIIENGQGQGAFDGLPRAWGSYAPWPNINNNVWINAEEENTLTVDHLVNSVFAGSPVSSTLLDPIRANFISSSDHATDGYRKVSDVSYPCFTTSGGRRVELREGIWNGTGHDDNLKLINVPVFKHHDGTGVTGALKHTYGILTMSDGYSGIRHYSQSGTQCGRMFIETRAPVLNIVDCIWVSQDSLSGYPVSTTTRTDTLLAGIDPVALDYHASKHILLPLGGSYTNQHDPDTFSGLINHLDGAQTTINNSGGIGGQMSNRGDANIDVFSANADAAPSPDLKVNGADSAVTLPATTPVSVRLSLVAGGYAGRRADQWVVARTPSGWWSYAQGAWKPGFRRFSSGPLGDMPSKEILNSTLPPGEYTIYCAVDDNVDGIFDATWWDSVRIRVTP